MNYDIINRLSATLPLPSGRAAYMDDEKKRFGVDYRNIRFMRSYADLDFGWKAAMALGESSCEFPLFLEDRDLWVYRAWLMHRQPNLAGHTGFHPIMEAVHLHKDPIHRPTTQVLNALLISSDSTIESVASALHIDVDVVAAYEVLFYNVMDRKKDNLFLRNQVYPHTRLEEMLEGYFQNHGSLEKMLIRLGYNRGSKEVLHFAGFRTDLMDRTDGKQASGLFQQELLVNGYILARNGFLDMSHHHATIVAAKQIVTASKLGGEDQGVDGNHGPELGQALRGMAVKRSDAYRQRAERQREKARAENLLPG